MLLQRGGTAGTASLPDAARALAELNPLPTVRRVRGAVRLIDQTRLPEEYVLREVGTIDGTVEAIRALRVRGAPAIGVCAAAALAALADRCVDEGRSLPESRAALEEAARTLTDARPTAVNLRWAVERVAARWRAGEWAGVNALADALGAEADAILVEDLDMSARMGRAGAALLPGNARVLTHCNTGGLATAGLGTALAVVFALHADGRGVSVLADETRPLLQGARLTAWELTERGIPVRVLVDGAAGWAMARGMVDAVLIGADRVAANGDTANKIGSYPLAVLAQRHGIPFYVVLPSSTIDASLPTGEAIPIEERDPNEVIGPRDAGADGWNPAFDVTPASLITAWITEEGVVRPPFHHHSA